MSSRLLRTAVLVSISTLLAASVAHADHDAPPTGFANSNGFGNGYGSGNGGYSQGNSGYGSGNGYGQGNGGYGSGNGYGQGNGGYGSDNGHGNEKAGHDHDSCSFRSISLGFERLDARVERNQLLVDYKLQRQSWKMVERQGLRPMLRVERRWGSVDAVIDRREGVLVFDLPRRGAPREIVVSVTGSNGRVTVDSLWVNGAPAERLTLAVAIPRPVRPWRPGRLARY